MADYKPTVTIYETLGIALSEVIESNGFTPTFLSKQLAHFMGFVSSRSKNVSSGFMEYIRSVKAGCIYGKPNMPKDPEKGLERLTVLLYALNFSETHPEIIDGIKEFDGRFQYPPENGISYAQLIEVYKVIEAHKVAKRNEKEVRQRLEAIV